MAAAVTYDDVTKQATLVPTAELSSSTAYTATVTVGVTDVALNPLVAPEVWTFTTADTTAPTVTGVTPAAGATNVATTTSVVATFSESMDPTSITPYVTVALIVVCSVIFLWQLAQRNPYAARLVSGASLSWCEQASACTLMDLYARALEDQALLAPRMAEETGLWNRLLSGGVSNRRDVRLAARVAALQTVLTQRRVRPYRPLAAAARRMPPVKTRHSARRGK